MPLGCISGNNSDLSPLIASALFNHHWSMVLRFCKYPMKNLYITASVLNVFHRTPTAGLAFVFNVWLRRIHKLVPMNWDTDTNFILQFWLKLRALAVSRSAKETTFQKCTVRFMMSQVILKELTTSLQLVAAPYIVFALTVVVTACVSLLSKPDFFFKISNHFFVVRSN